jgi:ABC-type cobalamin/Fe3+-siderophores transport system ATPase subunit
MLRHLRFKFGRGPSAPSEALDLTPVTVFVGPNNSGKSLVLNEIYQYCQTAQSLATDLVVQSIDFTSLLPEDAKKAIAGLRIQPLANDQVPADHIVVGSKGRRSVVREEELINWLCNPSSHRYEYASAYLSYSTARFDGGVRMHLVDDQNAGDLQQPPQSSFQVLFRDDKKRLTLRQVVFDAFRQYLVIDPTYLGKLRLRLSDVAPRDHRQERGIDEEAVRFHAASRLVTETSDGTRAFIGILAEIVAGDPKLLLVDEPEAFLHPALAFKLGKEVARMSKASTNRVLVSTHSPFFVMGCIQSGAPVNIVRLTYSGGVATARVLPSVDLVRLMRNPLLRSTGLLSGLFYEFVVVTESDADRAFYQEVNERLLEEGAGRGIPNCLFINAQNKQTVRQLVKPLRSLGIPSAAIVDIDVLKDGGKDWTDLLASANIPSANHQSLGSLRATIKKLFESTGKDMKREGGTALLTAPDRETADNLFDQLAAYGVFVVRRGELESWQRHLGASGHGPQWLIGVFEKMGEDPVSAGYVRPESNDVWDFMGDIRKWLLDGVRKGIPS